MATRKLTFITTTDVGVSTNTNLLLTFDPVDKQGLYHDQFPVAWKVLKFTAGKSQAAAVTYSARLGAAVAQIDSGIVQSPQSFVELGLGQRTVYTIDQDGFSGFDEPTPKPAPGTGLIVAQNESGSRQDMSIGMINNDIFEPLLAWPQIANGAQMAAKFTPVLRAYAYGGYKETAIITGELRTQELGSWNLALLKASPNVNTFRLFEDANDGGRLRLVLNQ